MADQHDIRELFDATAFDKNGDKLGSIKEIFVDDNSGKPTFIEVGHGLFGMSSSLVPLRGAALEGEDLNLAFSKDRIKDAPDLAADRNLSAEQQQELYRHYGVESSPEVAGFVGTQPNGGAADVEQERDREAERKVAEERAASEPQHAAAGGRVENGNDDELILSEERLNVSKDRVATGEARLRKYVVEDKQTVEVPVTREEVRVERTPIDPEEAKNYRGDISEGETSVTLHEERVNVSKESVPVEKVSLNKEQVADKQTVSETLRKEQVDADEAAQDK